MDFCWKQVEEHKKGIRTMYYPVALSWQRQCLSALRSNNNGEGGFAIQRNDKPSPVFANHQKKDNRPATQAERSSFFLVVCL